MMIKNLCSLILMLLCVQPLSAQELPLPSQRQLNWQQLETTAFLHFSVNTFTGKEWGTGTESPAIFNPVDFDARKMVKTLKETGFKMAIITAKHHDGFCLWPSAYTEHSVKNSPWRKGKGDIVKEIEQACREYGIQFGFYLSPWDMNNPSYGTPAYNTFYKNQLRELLTNYGEIAEVWFDGAKGKNAKDMNYDFDGYWAMVRELQPQAVMFSDVGPDVRWVGNEKGNAGETSWSTITIGPDHAPGKMPEDYLNTGDPEGISFIPPETDVSIRPGWFYHQEEDALVKTPQALVNLYYQSVGRNSLLLLNIPPDQRGLFAAQDVKNLYEYRTILDETFRTDLAAGKIDPKLSDRKLETFVRLEIGQPLVLDLGGKVTFDRLLLQENIANGQRNVQAKIEIWSNQGWQELALFSTIGHKRLFKTTVVSTTKIRFTVVAAKGHVELAALGLYKASPRE